VSGATTWLGIALGGAVFVGALLIPQRALREATAAHDEVQRDLRAQIGETQSALMVAKEATSAKQHSKLNFTNFILRFVYLNARRNISRVSLSGH